MKNLTSILLVFALLTHMNTHGQVSQLTLDNLIPGGKTYHQYVPKTMQRLAWFDDQLTYQREDAIVIAPLKEKDKEKTLITLQEINLLLENEEQLTSITNVSLLQNSLIAIKATNNTYIYNVESKQIVAKYPIQSGVSHIDQTKDALHRAYVKEDNLYIQNGEGDETAITTDGSKAIVYGQSVHQNEFGISKGTFWSPKGNLLAFYRMDQSMVGIYPLVNTNTRIASLVERPYPMAGLDSHHVTVGVYNLKTKKTVYLATGLPKEKFLTNITWSPDETTIYIAELNREQNECTLNSYDAVTGKRIATLFTETHPKYVEPQNPLLFLKNDPTKFIWQSRKDGYNHLYIYDTKGKLDKQLTQGEFEVLSISGFDQKGEHLIYSSTEVHPLEKHTYKINLKNGKRVKLTQQEGVHQTKLNASGTFIYDKYTSLNNPGKIEVVNISNGKNFSLHQANNPFEGINLPSISLGQLKANDGKTDLYYRLVKPANLDENKKYPVIVYVYGGPHSQMVTNSWQGQVRGWDIYMAQKGYIVFTLDNRGTSNRGFDFENITHRQLGIVETQDQMTGIEFLKSLPYVDTQRIGVHGWSYGGFMTLNLMLRHSETFKVGVAGGPVTDWKYYEIMYGERYMDSPQENPEGYKETSMLNHIGNLKGRLLLIHGDEDPVVVMQHTSQLLRSAVKEGVHPDLFIYPGHEHNVMGIDRIHLHEHITRYFDDFLK